MVNYPSVAMDPRNILRNGVWKPDVASAYRISPVGLCKDQGWGSQLAASSEKLSRNLQPSEFKLGDLESDLIERELEDQFEKHCEFDKNLPRSDM